jgi:hypothetical protein
MIILVKLKSQSNNFIENGLKRVKKKKIILELLKKQKNISNKEAKCWLLVQA